MATLGGCKSQNQVSPSQASASEKAAAKYLQAVVAGDRTTVDQMSPMYAQLPDDYIVGTVFRGKKVGEAEIEQGHLLTAQQYRDSIDNLQSFNASDQAALTLPNMQKRLMDQYAASDVVFYKFEVKETSGQKRTLSAYVTALKAKTGGWMMAPGLGDGFYTYMQAGVEEIQ